MFDWIKRLFGEGTLYVEFMLDDGTSGTAKMPYIGDAETMTQQDCLKHLQTEIWHKHRRNVIRVTKITFV